MSHPPYTQVENERRFWLKVDKTETCWNWTGATRGDGHGHLVRDGRWTGAHRYAYQITRGPIPTGLVIDHLCRNGLCVNPDHLEPVTQRVNTLRGVGFAARNAVKTHCPQGHEYTPENTYLSRRNQRTCRTCIQAWDRNRVRAA